MPKVIYRGPTHRIEIDDRVIEKDGEPVDLSNEDIARITEANGTAGAVFEEVGSSGSRAPAPPAPVQPPTPNGGGS